MALIKCPECGREISNRAEFCPVCGYPIAFEKSKGKIRLKLGMYGGIGGTQSVTITSNDQMIWSGDSGQVAEFELTERTDVEIRYASNAMHWGGSCQGVIDPDSGNKYAVSIRQGVFKTVLTFQIVDIIDSE